MSAGKSALRDGSRSRSTASSKAPSHRQNTAVVRECHEAAIECPMQTLHERESIPNTIGTARLHGNDVGSIGLRTTVAVCYPYSRERALSRVHLLDDPESEGSVANGSTGDHFPDRPLNQSVREVNIPRGLLAPPVLVLSAPRSQSV